MTTLTKTFATGSVAMKTGIEGPRHDPYGYTEWTWERSGHRIVLHEGLGDWVEIDGTRIDRGTPARWVFETSVGISLKTLERVIHRPKRCCDRQSIYEVDGYPGESFDVCGNCGAIVDGSFNESAVI